jgi:3'(2'), 5'-bisphosphate nucleotidase
MVDSDLSADTITDGIKSFITKDFLNEKQAARADWIRDQLTKTYESDEVSVDPWETFNTKDAVVWIDPLDGTSDFVKGNLPAVTVLIGLSIGGKSRLGIVHNPFSEEDQSVGKTVFGCAEFGTFKIPYNKESSGEELLAREITQLEHFDHSAEPAEDHKIRVAVTLSHFSDTIKQIIETIEPVEIVRIGGAGNKCCHVSLGTVDSYIHPSPGLKYWDLCAPESLIKGMGGYSTDLFQQRLTYPLDGDKKLKGLILGKNPPMYNMICRRLGDLLKNITQTVKL